MGYKTWYVCLRADIDFVCFVTKSVPSVPLLYPKLGTRCKVQEGTPVYPIWVYPQAKIGSASLAQSDASSSLTNAPAALRRLVFDTAA